MLASILPLGVARWKKFAWRFPNDTMNRPLGVLGSISSSWLIVTAMQLVRTMSAI
jgi:hypothetical protein